MRKQSSFSVLRWMSLVWLLLAIVLLILQLIGFSRLWANYPSGLTIASIPVGNLDRQAASERLLEVYNAPVDLYYGENVIRMAPSVVGVNLELESMLAAAEQERTRTPFWQSFWNYLWGRPTPSANIPLVMSFSQERLRAYLLTEVAARYDQPPTPARPVPGTVNFEPGSPGASLDIARSVLLIENALRSNTRRSTTLILASEDPSRPTFQYLDILLRQAVVDINAYDGAIGLYMFDLKSGQEISFIYDQRQLVSVPPDVAFTASSTIKIPIMVSAFRRLGDQPQDKPINEATQRNLDLMISQSNNTASDWIMNNVLDPISGPLVVSEDMKLLGLENTFLGGYFYSGAPLLFRYRTPANQRSDVKVERDPYSQTTAAEMGMLLADIYQCAQNGGGALSAVFPGEISQAECQEMITQLKNDRTPWLIPAGVPDGTEIAHKHGWVQDIFGIIHDMSDAAIVFTPGGDYVLSIFMYHPVQLVFDPTNALVVDLSRAVYNFYNLPGE